jgi:hypothetical protein
MSLGETPLKTCFALRVKENFCCPTPMSNWNELAPAEALNVAVLFPDVTSIDPADFKRLTTNTESCMSSQPFGLPLK